MKCLLGIDPEKTQKCKPSECASCGWEAAEAARRREYVKEHGLTLCADGFRRLISKGFKIDAETLDKLIEAAVFNLPDYFTISGIPADTDSNKE